MILTHYAKTTDSYIRNRVIQLEGNQMACTGIEVKAPSGRNYILTAAHCRALANENSEIDAITEHDKRAIVHIIEFDAQHDLMLLTAIDNLSIEVAGKISAHQKIHTMTHGGRFPSYRTDGEMLEEREVRVRGEDILNEKDMAQCSGDFQYPSIDERGLYCAMKLTMAVSTAYVIPGSSGGPALDSSGRLVGIVSCTYGQFSGLVPLHDIIQFLKSH
jgi:S1-C subfamily serine protease